MEPSDTFFTSFWIQVDKINYSKFATHLRTQDHLQSGLHRLSVSLRELVEATNQEKSRSGPAGPAYDWNRVGDGLDGGTVLPNRTPRTPPQTPGAGLPLDTGWQVSELQERLRLSETALLDQTRALAAVKDENVSLRQQISVHQATTEELRNICASSFTKHKKYSAASQQFELLCNEKAAEEADKRSQGDNAAAQIIKKQGLKYKHECGRMLLLAKSYAEAEVVLGNVLDVRKQDGDPTVSKSDTRETFLLYCQALRAQAEAQPYKRVCAASMHFQASGNVDENDFTWSVRNAMIYAHIKIEQGEYDQARLQIGHALPLRSRIAGLYVQEVNSVILQIAKLLRERNETDHRIAILSVACESQSGATSAEDARVSSQLGNLLYYEGRYQDAVLRLNYAWQHRSLLPAIAAYGRRLAACDLARSLIKLGKRSHFEEAKTVISVWLADPEARPGTERTSPEQFNTMLAYTHFRLGAFAEAETIARDLYAQHKFRTIGDLDVENHALVLLQALTKQQALDKLREAFTLVWEPLFKARNEFTSTPDRKALLKRHISAGNALVIALVNASGKWPPVPVIRRNITELEPLCE